MSLVRDAELWQACISTSNQMNAQKANTGGAKCLVQAHTAKRNGFCSSDMPVVPIFKNCLHWRFGIWYTVRLALRTLNSAFQKRRFYLKHSNISTVNWHVMAAQLTAGCHTMYLVTFQVAQCYHPLTILHLYCFVTEAQVCKCHMLMA